MCFYTQDIVDTEYFLMPISTVHETNTFDLKHIPTDSSLFKLSKYDNFFYQLMLSYHTACFKINHGAQKTLRKYLNLIKYYDFLDKMDKLMAK